ncbi:FeoB small GTPase domain-containing protein [candidate division KSB1 bacterium]
MNQIEKKRAKFSNISKKIIIVGNPNVGKSTIFRKLCSKNSTFYIYPDTSVEIGVGWYTYGNNTYEVIDTPGGSGLYDLGEDDNIIRNIILNEKDKIILQVSDFRNIKMSLRYLIELTELETPMVFAFNMADEMRLRGITVNNNSFNNIFGIKAVETVADEGEGIYRLKKALSQAGTPHFEMKYPERIESSIKQIMVRENNHLTRAHSLLQILIPESIENIFKLYSSPAQNKFSSLGIELTQLRATTAASIEKQIVHYEPPQRIKFIERFEKWTRIPVTGIPIFFLILLTIYLFVGLLGSGVIVDFIQVRLFENIIIHYAALFISTIKIPLIYDFFVGQYGIISFALTLCFGIVLPIVTTFYFAFSFIEESGYLPRLSILLDKTLKKIGMSGRAIMPIVLGFSCITMALLSTRVLESKKERLITTMILILAIPCSAQSAILLAVVSTISLKAILVISFFIVAQVFLTSYLLNKYLKGEPSTFMIELLPLRIPDIKGILYKTIFRVKIFVREIFPLFIIAGFLLFLMEKLRILEFIEKIGKPIVTNFMGLPEGTASVLILSAARKEAGAAVIKSLFDNQLLNEVQVITMVIVTLLFVPCFSSFMVLIKEHGLKNALLMYVSVFVYAILMGGFVNYLLKYII